VEAWQPLDRRTFLADMGKGAFVLAVFGLENLIIGLASGMIALALSQTAAWIICRSVLDVPYKPFAGVSLLMALAATLVVIAVGLGASIPVLRKKPAAFLRERAEE
jgi:putative ABC transport system permease protein